MTYQGDRLDWSFLLQSYQTLDRLVADTELPYRKLPQIRVVTRPDAHDGLSWNWDAEFTRFEHPEPDALPPIETANRGYIQPGLEYRIVDSAGFLRSRLSYLTRYYEIESAQSNESQVLKVSQPIVSIDSGLIFERSFTAAAERFVQTLEPRAFYLYTPYRNQAEIPLFDTAFIPFSYAQLFRDKRYSGIDRIGDANQISVGVSTALFGQRTGQEYFRASLGQMYLFKRSQVSEPDLAEKEAIQRSAIAGLISWMPSDTLGFHAALNWDDSSRNVDNGSLQIRYGIAGQGVISGSYRYYDDLAGSTIYEKEQIDQSDVSLAWRIYDRWQFLGRWRYDLGQHKSLDNLIGLAYESCCWSLSLIQRRYLREDDEDATNIEAQQGIHLQFQLIGLGGVGARNNRLIADAISGLDLINRPVRQHTTTSRLIQP
jgi:LPS-assembly protein